MIDTVAHQVRGDEAIVGANKEYAAIHQFGGAAVGKPGLPARPYLGLGAQDRAEVQAMAEKWIARQLKA